MATKKPGLVVDILAGGPPPEEEPPAADDDESPPPPSSRGGNAESLIEDIQGQLDRLRAMMADL